MTEEDGMADDKARDLVPIEQEEDSATLAFERLRTEVGGMRSALEGLLPVLESMIRPDYTPSLSAIKQTLGTVEKRLAGIEQQPALKLTPEQHAQAMSRAGAGLVGEAARALRDESEDLGRERRQLAEIVGTTRTRHAQRRALLWTLAAGLAAGLVLFPLLGAFAPGGSYLAALAMGIVDRWQAGASLMQVDNPAGSNELWATSRLLNANVDALRSCRAAARKSNTEQKCSIVVPVQ